MFINFKGEKTYIGTGGKKLDKNKTTICFIHGSGQNHLSFVQQARYFAHKGYSVIVPDMPGHGFSEGKPCISIKENAKWVYDLIKEIKVNDVVFLGHSQGCLVGLELNQNYPNLLKGIIFIAGSNKIPVNDYLIDLASNNIKKAYKMMVTWGHGKDGAFSTKSMPGHSHFGEGLNIMNMNQETSLKLDLLAINEYTDGVDASKKINIPTLAVLAKYDQMTPIKSGKKFVDLISECDLHILDCGHFLQAERPKELNAIIHSYLKKLHNINVD
jgi:pimeloyl-ACP methyl ester carboxylesterase